MSGAQPLVDVLGLANRPVGADCVKWSEDGVLAVAAGHSAVLLRPGDLAGPRAFASPGGLCDVDVLHAPGRPAKPTEDAHHELAHLRAAAMVSNYPSLQAGLAARCLGWSPAGCSAAAGCLLAVVTNDHQVLVYGPPAEPRSEWQQVANLSGQLLDHLEHTGWRDLQPPAPQQQQQQQQQGEEGCLRLRGGGRTKRKASAAAGEAGVVDADAPIYRPDDVFEATVGQEVEVMSAEEGLYGCWFTGTIQRLAGGWALVAYDELREAEGDDSPPLREWFPIPGQRQQAGGPLAGAASGGPDGGAGHTVHSIWENHHLRPAPPPRGVGTARAVGDTCDAFVNGAWWETARVVEVQDGGQKLVVEVDGEQAAVDLALTRTTLRFTGGQWLAASTCAADAAAAAAAVAAAEAEQAGKKKSGRKLKQPKEQQQQTEAQEEEEEAPQDGPAPGDERPSKKRRGSKATAAAVAAAGAEEPSEAQQERQEQQQGAAAQQEQEPEVEQQEQEQPLAPGKKGAGLRSPRKQRQPTAAHAGDGATPRAAGDEAGSAAAAAAGASSAGGAKSKKAPASSTKKAPASSAKKAAPAYEVPADFDPSVLPEVDLSSLAEAKRSMPTAFARRFLALRRLVPEADLPSYPGTSSHLKGIDAELVAQAVAELLHVHGDALGALGGKLDTKWLNTEGRTKLRNVWDRTRNKLLGGFKVAEGDATEPESDEETEDEQPQAGGEGGGGAASRRRAGRASSAGPSGGTLYGEGGEEGEETEEGAGPRKAGDGDSDDELPRGRGKGAKRRSSAAGASSGAALDFPPHEMPEGFSWRSLPGVDFSNESAAKKTLLLSAVRRFLTLRAEYPEEELPSYEKKSSHLRGRDAWLVDRITREFLAAYAQLMDDLGWTPKSFQTYWLSRLRAVWDKTTARLSEGFKLEPEPAVLRSAQEAAEVATMAVGADPQAAEALAARGPQLQHRSPAKPPKKSASRKSLASLAGEEEEGAATAARSARSGRTREDGYSSERSDGLVLASASAKRKRKDLAAATAAARMRRDSTGGAELSSAEYQHRLLGSCGISCAWSPAVDLPPGAAQPAAAAAEAAGAAAGAAGGEAAPCGAAAPAPAAQRCCFLALGAKAGRIWLWRYHLPAQYRLDQPQGDVSDSFELVGCLAGSPGAWVNSLAWQLVPSRSSSGGSNCSSSLVLVAGCSDGSVLLYGADAQQLAATTAQQQAPSTPVQEQQQPLEQPEQQQQQPMQRWCVACQPDCRVVTTLSVQLQPSTSSGISSSRGGRAGQLLVAAGKAAGSLAVWRSGPLSSCSSSAELAKALGSGAASLAAVSIQGTRPVTGLSWLPPCQRQQGAPLLLASTQDGTVACWRLAEASGSAGLALLPADGVPQPCSKRKKRSVGHCAFGLAVSPGGLFAAVVRLALPPTAEIVKQLQVHERVVQGLVQLDRLAGPGAPLEVQAALSAALTSHAGCAAESNDAAEELEQQRLVQGCLTASSAWEAAALLRLHAKWQGSSAAEAAADAPMGGSSSQEAVPAAPVGGDGGLVPPLAAAVLQQLEQPMLDLLHSFQARQAAAGPASGEAGTGEALLPQVPPAVWRSLQLATALRHLLNPARVQQEQRQQAKKQLRKVGGTAPQPDMLSLQQLLKAEPVEAAVGGGGSAIDMAVDEGGSDEEAEEDGQQQQQQAAQPPALTPELIAQHGAFASLFLAAAPLPPPPQPVINKKKQKALEKQQAARAQAQAAQQLEAQQRAAAAAAAAAAVLAVVDVPEAPLVQEWRAATERNEMLLLQRHLAATLAPLQPPEDEEGMDVDGSGPGGEGAAEPAAAAGAATDAAGGEARLSQLLMADWITLNVRDPGTLQEMDVMAASAYLHTNEEMLPHGAAMPAREHSTLFDEPVAVAGSGVAAATQAIPPSAGGATLPRCPATLLLCEGRPHWSCRACGRRYRRPQGAGNADEAGDGQPLGPLPSCIFCGLPLGSAVPAVLFSPPCCS